MSFGVSSTTNPWATQQTDPSQTNAAPNGGMRQFANLNLTEAQRTQVRSILHNAKQNGTSQSDVQSQISALLTPDQQATYQSDLQQQTQGVSSTSSSSSSSSQTQTQSNVFANLNLTSQQQQQISTILQNAQSQGTDPKQVRSQIASVLSPTQQSTLQSNVQNARSAGSGRHHDNDGDGQSASTTSTTSATSTTLASSAQQQAWVQQLLNQINSVGVSS